MATPVMAGGAALIAQYFQEGWYPSGRKTTADKFVPMGALVKAVLINGAQKLTGYSANKQSSRFPNMDQGHGRMELDQTLNFDDTNPGHGLFVRGDFGNMPSFASSSSPDITYTFVSTGTSCTSDSTKDFRATLVWHDYPYSQTYGRALVNDLDIKVTGNGQTYYPNGKNARDSLNNVEQVIVSKPKSGATYTVTISAFAMHQLPDPPTSGPDNSCEYANDNLCDEPAYCYSGTDLADCGPPTPVSGVVIPALSQPYSLVVSGCFVSPDRDTAPSPTSPAPTPPSPTPPAPTPPAPSDSDPYDGDYDNPDCPDACNEGCDFAGVTSASSCTTKCSMWGFSNANDYIYNGELACKCSGTNDNENWGGGFSCKKDESTTYPIPNPTYVKLTFKFNLYTSGRCYIKKR